MPRGVGGGSVGRAGGFAGEKRRICPVPRRVGCAVGEHRRRGVPAQGWVCPGQPGLSAVPLRRMPSGGAGGARCAEPGRARGSRAHTDCSGSAGAAPAALLLPRGKRGSSPSPAGPLRFIQELPREAMRLSGDPPPAPAPRFALAFPARLRAGPGFAGVFGFALRCLLRAAGGSGIAAGWSRLRNRSGSGRAGVTRLGPRVPAPGAPADAAGSGEPSGGIAARPLSCRPPSPFRSARRRA